MVSNQTNALREFMLEPDICTYARAAASEALGQLALHQPERRGEIIDFYSPRFFTIFAQRPPKQVDPNLNDTMVIDAISCGLSELLPEIKVLIEREYLETDIVGNYDQIVEAYNEPKEPADIQLLLSIIDLYELINFTWLSDKGDYDDDLTEAEEAEWEKSMITRYSTTSLTSTPKPGCNAPCP